VWDSRQLARSWAAAALALGLACLVTAMTDEGGVSWAARLGRTAPLAPVCAAVGAWAALVPLRARGEALALESLGRSRAEIAAAAVSGGAMLAIVVAALLAILPPAAVAGFFPTATHASTWGWDGAGFLDVAQGLHVSASGAPSRMNALAGLVASGVPAYGRASAAVVTATCGLALPVLLARSMLARAPALPGLLAAGLALAACLLLFQAAAAHRVPAPVSVVPALTLLGFALRRYRA
jgi:hypothetical protein